MFLSLPTELVQHVLCFCTPQAVAAFSQTCRLASTLIYDTEDQHLWREIFLSVPFDNPGDSPDYDPCIPIDWKTELQRRIRASSAVAFTAEDLPFSPEMGKQVFDAFESLVKVAHSAIPPFHTDPDSPPVPSHNMRWLTDVLARCAPFYDPEHSTAFNGHSDHLERLLAYWSTPLRGVPTGNLHTQSRCFVYDLRKYTLESNWGVYRVAGTEQIDETRARYIYETNWEHVKHCVNAVLFGIKHDGTGAFAHPPNPTKLLCPPMGFNSIRAYSAPGSFNRKPEDWAGVEGVWVRYVCFMDYSDLAGKPSSPLTCISGYTNLKYLHVVMSEFNVSTSSLDPSDFSSGADYVHVACPSGLERTGPAIRNFSRSLDFSRSFVPFACKYSFWNLRTPQSLSLPLQSTPTKNIPGSTLRERECA
jgi:hypothetical protein